MQEIVDIPESGAQPVAHQEAPGPSPATSGSRLMQFSLGQFPLMTRQSSLLHVLLLKYKWSEKMIPGPLERVASQLTGMMDSNGILGKTGTNGREGCVGCSSQPPAEQQLCLSLSANDAPSAPQPCLSHLQAPGAPQWAQTGSHPRASGSWSYYLNCLPPTSPPGSKPDLHS